MKTFALLVLLALLGACGGGSDSISSEQLEDYFRSHRIDGNTAVALKKRSAGESYLVTVHGYPDNMAVCQKLIAPYNNDPGLSVVGGSYFCEPLR